MKRREFAEKLGGVENAATSTVVIEERDPGHWRRVFATAAAGRGPVFLGNPDWGSRERADFDELVGRSAEDWDAEVGWLMIPTGGSGGVIKLARHDQSSLMAAVRGYRTFFDEPVISAMGVLPLHHVGGLMGWLRSALTGGDFLDGDWAKIKTLVAGLATGEGKTISLVPTQLKSLLEKDEGAAWLRTFSRVLIGGAGLDDTLAQRARDSGVVLVRSYGATETAALVAAEDATKEWSPGMQVLPHAAISFDELGQIEVSGESVCRGYWPARAESSPVWRSGDSGTCTDDGRIVIDGRIDDLIITGGEKVDPREVERVLRLLVEDERLAVLGVSDATWGQRVVVVCHPDVPLDLAQLKAAGIKQIAPFKWPKQVFHCDPWPVNSVGKLDRSKLRAAAGTAS